MKVFRVLKLTFNVKKNFFAQYIEKQFQRPVMILTLFSVNLHDYVIKTSLHLQTLSTCFFNNYMNVLMFLLDVNDSALMETG